MIDFESKFETIHIGKKFVDGQEFVETLPDQSVNIESMNIKSIMFRMDLLFDEKVRGTIEDRQRKHHNQ